MKRDFDLLITNQITNDVEVIPRFSKLVYASDFSSAYSSILFLYLKPYLDNQIPISLEFAYKY